MSTLEYRLYKTQLQVMDTYWHQLDSTTERIAKQEKEEQENAGKIERQSKGPNKKDEEDDQADDTADPDPTKVLCEKYKDELEFVEPQSMNYDIKLNHVYKEFVKAHPN